MSDARGDILAAVRAALERPSPVEAAPPADGMAAIRRGRADTVPADPEGLVARFARELEALSAEFLVAPDLTATVTALREHLDESASPSIAAAGGDAMTDAVATGLEATGLAISRLEDMAPDARRAHLAETTTVITGADYGLAATGTLVCTPTTLPDRLAAGLPLHHVALLRADRLVPDAATLLERHGEIADAALLFISGPSRTADVEKTLVLGAHGPARLTVVLVGASPAA